MDKLLVKTRFDVFWALWSVLCARGKIVMAGLLCHQVR